MPASLYCISTSFVLVMFLKILWKHLFQTHPPQALFQMSLKMKGLPFNCQTFPDPRRISNICIEKCLHVHKILDKSHFSWKKNILKIESKAAHLTPRFL